MALASYGCSFKSFVTVWSEAFSTSTLKNQTSAHIFLGVLLLFKCWCQAVSLPLKHDAFIFSLCPVVSLLFKIFLIFCTLFAYTALFLQYFLQNCWCCFSWHILQRYWNKHIPQVQWGHTHSTINAGWLSAYFGPITCSEESY
jgi:hypothetical protein